MDIAEKETQSLENDSLFKKVFLNKKNNKFYLLESLLKECLDKDITILENIYPELKKKNYKEKKKVVDLLVTIPSGYINIEVNSNYDKTIRFRNYLYLNSFISTDTSSGKNLKNS